MNRNLVFAYSCDPVEGSEGGAGWRWSCLIAQRGPTVIVTRTSNRESIETYIRSHPAEQLDITDFVYVDLPAWARGWKKGNRGVRIYYTIWQLLAVSARKKFQHQLPCLSWHVTLGNAWLGSAAPLLRQPFVWGPVGGGVSMPWRLARILGVRGLLTEVSRSLIRAINRYLNPLARLAWCHAKVILVQNIETMEWLPKKHRNKIIVFPNPIIDATNDPRQLHSNPEETKTILYAGRLLPWKGVALAIMAMPLLQNVQLLICGEGSDLSRLRRLAQKHRVAEKVKFLGNRPRSEVLALMREADAFVFPSLHDDAPWAVAEALAVGLPVVCLDRGGPRQLTLGMGPQVKPGWPAATTRRLARSLTAAMGPPNDRVTDFSEPRQAEKLADLLGQFNALAF